MHNILRVIGQAVFFAGMIALVGFFSNRPVYHQVPDGMAQIKLSFAHGGARKVDCRRLSVKEIAALPANERRPNTCSRERIPVYVQLSVDDKIIYDEQLTPTGLANDGSSRTYAKFLVAAGEHVVIARLRDSKRTDGFDYEARQELSLQPLQNLAIDFKADAGGFTFK